MFNGIATWAYAPTWSTASTWSGKVDAVAATLKAGRTAATSDGSFGFFTIAGHYPGDAFTSTTGSTVYYTVYATALNNGYRVQMAWDFYRGYTRLSGGGSPILSSGSSYTWSNVATTVQSGKYGYYAATRFDYLNPDGSVAFSSYVYCGPTYITGN
jgi:hypothetical protein